MNFPSCLNEPLAMILGQTSGPGLEAAPIVLVLGILAAGLAYVGLWLWSLIHCVRNRMLSDNNRLIGIILIALLGILGSLIYLFLPRESTAQR